jgi:hypothetical protein
LDVRLALGCYFCLEHYLERDCPVEISPEHAKSMVYCFAYSKHNWNSGNSLSTFLAKKGEREKARHKSKKKEKKVKNRQII